MRRSTILPLVFIVVVAAGLLVLTFTRDWSPQLGLDLQGGVSVVLQPTEETNDDAISQSIEIIRNRVDAIGVAEPEITQQGDAIIVQLPGVEDQQRALELVGDTAELRFRPVLGVFQPSSEEATSTTAAGDSTTTTTAAETTTTTAAPAEGDAAAADVQLFQQPTTTTTAAPTTTTAPPPVPSEPEVTPREEDVADQPVVLNETVDGEVVATYQLGPTLATGEIVETARADLDETTGQWSVALTIKGGDGIEQFNNAAALCFSGAPECPTKQLAIVLDSNVVSAPTIQQESFERDQIQISGSFTEDEAKDLALVLRYGALPVELEPQTVQTVSATLGEDSLRAGLIAGFLGLALVCIYMLLYYRALGLVVILGLTVWASLLYSLIAWLGETQGLALTLSGVTGIVVSVGVTVDSYVVYFERLKDEVKLGRSIRSSVDRAFKRAFRTILAADVSSFIGAFLLYWLTVGPVRGFAFFLGLATILDVVVSWFFTRPMVALLARSHFFTEARVFGVARGLAAPPMPAQPATEGAL